MSKLYQENHRKGTDDKRRYHHNVTVFAYDNKIRDRDRSRSLFTSNLLLDNNH